MSNYIQRAYQAYQNFQPFTDAEAWMLFRIAAIGEAVGWSLLIIGILCRNLSVSWNEAPVQVAGRMHGTLFLIYIVAVVVLSPSLKWSAPRTLLAGLCSIPPYGSLLFEQWSARHRSWRSFRQLRSFIGYKVTTRQAGIG